jgi:hypothetical protein
VSTYYAYQASPTQQTTTPLLHYNQLGRFDYTVHLKNNTVYNTTSLRSGIGTYFTKLVTNINASFTYLFQIDTPATITGAYSIQASIQTNLWTKTYPLVSPTSFSTQGQTGSFNVSFPLNYSLYEQSLQRINDEIGITAQDPRLLIRCMVTLLARTDSGIVSTSISPVLNMSLGQKTIEISPDLTTSKPGTLSETTNIVRPEVYTQRTSWSVITLIVLVGFCGCTLGTESTIQKQTSSEALVQKILKKHHDFIVETDNKPNIVFSQVIMIKSFEDLLKMGEELAKPIMHYSVIQQGEKIHIFYVFDETIFYQYEVKPEKNSIDDAIGKMTKEK